MATQDSARALEVLTLDLQGETFAVEATVVREILDPGPTTEVPGSRPFVDKLINVRGKVVPLADLRLKFGMEPRAATIDTRIVVIEIELDGEPIIAAVLADKVYEVTSLAAATLEPTPRLGMRWRPEYIRCIGKHNDEFVIVLDVARVFSSRDNRVEEPKLAAVNG